MREDHWRTEAEPFRDLSDRHQPFPLVRRIHRRRPLWQFALVGYAITCAVLVATEMWP